MKRRIVWINVGLALVIVAAAVGGYFWLFAPKAEALTGRTVSVQTGTVSETVTATGTVETAGTVELSFAAGGTIDRIGVSEGDQVDAGRRLITLDDTSARQSIANAKSSYVQAVTGAQQTTLTVSSTQQSVSDATRNAELSKQSYQQTVHTARVNLAEAKSSWSDSCLDPNGACPDSDAWAQLRTAEADVTSARTAYDQAVQSASADETTNNLKVNQASVDAASATATRSNDCNTYGSSSQQCTAAVESERKAQQLYEMAVNSRATASVQSQQSLVNADTRVTQANIALTKLQKSLVKNAKDSLASAQDAVDAALLAQTKGLEADQQAIAKARQSLAAAQAAVQSVSTASGSMTPGQAAIGVAEAGLVSAEMSLEQTVLRAPVSGTIAVVNATEGQAVAGATPVLTLMPEADYQITAGFSEADAMKVKVGQKVAITFDALPDESATGTVTAIDIVATSGNNVTTYGTTITLDTVPTSLKDGMSASVVVTVNEASNVLWTPTAAITTAGGKSTVTVRKGGKDSTVQVTIGLAGDTGTEITSGVAAGDQLVVSTSDSSIGSSFPMGGIPGGGFSGGGGPPAGAAG